jgi:hypothetical protein
MVCNDKREWRSNAGEEKERLYFLKKLFKKNSNRTATAAARRETINSNYFKYSSYSRRWMSGLLQFISFKCLKRGAAQISLSGGVKNDGI